MDREPVRALPVLLAMVLLAGAIAAIALALGLGNSEPAEVEVAEIAEEARAPATAESGDPLAWTPQASKDLAKRATLGTSHVIYEKSPGGVVASAERTATWRDEIEAAAGPAGVDPDTLEAMVFLESAGRPDVMADGTPNSASGLGQIIPSTATDLLGLSVDLPRSVALTKAINKAFAKDEDAKGMKLMKERREVDERFNPERALEGAARYIEIATDRFGSEELAVVSYHMGIGNLENVMAAYGADADEVDYAQLFFDSYPQNHEEAWKLLSGFGDDSSLYLWRVRASLEIMRKWRDDPGALEDEASLALEKATLEETYHPEDETEVFDGPDDVVGAIDDGDLALVPNDASLGFQIAGQAGELAKELDVEPDLYHVLRPEALAALTYLSAKVQAISGDDKPLTVTSMTRDREYQELLIGVNAEATQEYSLHTTGFSFDIRRKYASDKQAAAFQFALDRLKAHAILDYAYEPAAIHVTVSSNARVLTD